MNSRSFFIISCTVLILLNIYLNLRIRGYKNEIEVNKNNLNYKEQSIKKLELGLSNFYQKDIIYKNRDSIQRNCPELVNLLSSGDKIIFYVQKGACGVCIIKLLQDLSILEETIGIGNVIIATNAGNKAQPFEFKDFNFPTIYISNFYFPQRYSMEPILFVIDNQMNIKMFYLPEILPQFKEKYFKEYLPAYFKNVHDSKVNNP